MKFVKENLFLICTAGATIVGAVVLLVLARSAGNTRGCRSPGSSWSATTART